MIFGTFNFFFMRARTDDKYNRRHRPLFIFAKIQAYLYCAKQDPDFERTIILL